MSLVHFLYCFTFLVSVYASSGFIVERINEEKHFQNLQRVTDMFSSNFGQVTQEYVKKHLIDAKDTYFLMQKDLVIGFMYFSRAEIQESVEKESKNGTEGNTQESGISGESEKKLQAIYELYCINIHKDFQRRQLGRYFIQTSVSEMMSLYNDEDPILSLTLDVFSSTMMNAAKLYLRMGFVRHFEFGQKMTETIQKNPNLLKSPQRVTMQKFTNVLHKEAKKITRPRQKHRFIAMFKYESDSWFENINQKFHFALKTYWKAPIKITALEGDLPEMKFEIPPKMFLGTVISVLALLSLLFIYNLIKKSQELKKFVYLKNQ